MENIIRIEDDAGNVYSPQTKSKAVFDDAGKTVEEKFAQVNVSLTTVLWQKNDWKTEGDQPSSYPKQSTTTFLAATNAFNGLTNVIVQTVTFNKDASTQYILGAMVMGNTAERLYYRQSKNNAWEPWREIATMDKVPQTESGVFTPTLETSDGGKVSQYSTQSGTYYKIGNLVRLYINIGIANMGSLGAGQNRIKGLPFVIKKSEAASGGIWYANVYLPTGTSQAIVSAVDGGVNLRINGCGNDKYTPFEVNNFKINSLFSIDMTVVI